MNLFQEYQRNITRRYFFSQGSHAVGWASLASLMGQASGFAGAAEPNNAASQPKKNLQHFVGKAKHVIYLHMVGGPPQMDLFDYKPVMNDWYDKDLPESVRNGQRLTTMTSGQARFPIAPSKFKFEQAGECGMWMSELLPWKKKMADDMVFIRSALSSCITRMPAFLARRMRSE